MPGVLEGYLEVTRKQSKHCKQRLYDRKLPIADIEILTSKTMGVNMFGIFKRKTIKDNMNDFDAEYSVAKLSSVKYLEIWFAQVFALPEWKEAFHDNPNISQAMAVEVLKLLFGDVAGKEDPEYTKSEEASLAKKHAPKWADDVMRQDKDFCELVVQTLRLEFIYESHVNGTDWHEKSKHGQKIYNTISTYGGLVQEAPTPETYTKLISKWIAWGQYVDQQQKGTQT